MSLTDISITDFAEALSLDDFATQAIFKINSADAGTTIPVIYVNEFDAATQAGIPVESAKPFIVSAAADVAGATHKSTITVGGIAYSVIGVHPSAGPGTKLVLSRSAD